MQHDDIVNVFAIFLPSNPGRLVPCTLDDAGKTLSNQTSNMILINATFLLVHFFTTSKFYVFVLCLRVYVLYVSNRALNALT